MPRQRAWKQTLETDVTIESHTNEETKEKVTGLRVDCLSNHYFRSSIGGSSIVLAVKVYGQISSSRRPLILKE
jgi:hypothetical protein